MAITDLITSVMNALGFGVLFFWLDKIAALFGVWYFGGKLSGKFKSKFNSGTLFVMRIVSGVFIYFLGIIFSVKFLPFLPSVISDFTGAFIVFLIFYFVVTLLTSDVAFRVVMRKEFDDLVDKVDKLSSMVDRIFQATTDKKIMPEKLDAKSAENSLKKVMKEVKRVDDFVVISSSKENDFINFNVKCRLRSFKVVLDAYTGKLVQVSHLRDTPKNWVISALNYFYEHKTATLGAVILVLFVNQLWLFRTPAFEERVAQLFSFEPPQTNDSFSMQDIVGGLGLIPQGSQVSGSDLQDYLSQIMGAQ